MRVCTLIIRLIGFYLLVYSTLVLIQVNTLQRTFPGICDASTDLAPHFGHVSIAVQRNIQIATWGGVAGMSWTSVLASEYGGFPVSMLESPSAICNLWRSFHSSK